MYIKTTYYVGDTIEVKKTMSWRYGKKIPRRKGKLRPTPENMADINEQNAIENLRRLMANNFTNNDLHLVAKYPRGKAPDALTSRKHVEIFLRDLRRLYKNWGYTLKYIHVTEYIKKQAHHHFVIKEIPIPLKAISTLWRWGGVNATPIYTAPDFAALAYYFIKETKNSFRDADSPSRRRWNSSRNLKIPKKVVEVVRANEWRAEPASIKGYYIDKDSVIDHISEDGYPSQFYRLIKINARK